jgi:dipeptidyl aminopeptidase/acylaminoacyl peptidase
MTRERLTNETLDQVMSAWLDERAHGPTADSVLDAALSRTSRTRPLPGWLLPERWLPGWRTWRLETGPRLAPILVILGLLLALALAIALVGSQRRLPPPFGLAAPGVVAFVADGNIWTANPDGSNRVQLTTDARIDGFPAFSRDGTRIAFKRLLAESSKADWEDWGDIVVADADGGNPIVLDADVHSPSPMTWSGDGRFLVYSRTADGFDQVFIAATDGSSLRRLTTDRRTNWSPILSPDGKTIAFMKGWQVSIGIYVIQTDGTGERRVTHGAVPGFDSMEWSPDGIKILYASGPNDAGQFLWTVGLDGEPEHRVVDTPGRSDFAPTWSPDGLSIAWLSQAPGGVTRVMVARADGSNRLEISEPGDWFLPQWSPDARHVLAVDGRNGGGQPIVAILDPLGISPATSFAIPDVSGFGRADFASWQRLALP